jgi:hypothetical protein
MNRNIIGVRTFVTTGMRGPLYREADGRSTSLHRLLDHIWSDSENVRGRNCLQVWMRKHALDLVAHEVSKEMQTERSRLYMSLPSVTPQYVESYNLQDMIGPILQVAPT